MGNHVAMIVTPPPPAPGMVTLTLHIRSAIRVICLRVKIGFSLPAGAARELSGPRELLLPGSSDSIIGSGEEGALLGDGGSRDQP